MRAGEGLEGLQMQPGLLVAFSLLGRKVKQIETILVRCRPHLTSNCYRRLISRLNLWFLGFLNDTPPRWADISAL